MYTRLLSIFLILISTLAISFPLAAATPEASEAIPPLAAQYRETTQSGGQIKMTRDWYLLRRADRIATAGDDRAEIWQRDARGDISLVRVFHGDRKLIEYTGGELRTQQRYPDWTRLGSVFDPRRIPAMKPVGKQNYLGRPATRYRQRHDGVITEVIWLNQESLAASIVRRRGGVSTTLAIKELRDSPAPAWPVARLDGSIQIDGIEDYARIDGADLGDMESDPFVKRIMGDAEEHGGHAHSHAAHR